MRMLQENFDLANELGKVLENRTQTISDAETVTMIMLWCCIQSHANAEDMNAEELVRYQLDAFLKFARENIQTLHLH